MKRFFLLFFCLFWTIALSAKPLQIEVQAKSAILMNADSGAILFEKNVHSQAFPASTTKIATAIYVLENADDLSRMVTVSGESMKFKPAKGDWSSIPSYWHEWDGTKMGIQRGEVLSMEALLHGLMMVSGNDAANVLAETISGTIPRFMDELNKYISSLGCKATFFNNPHGLHHQEHVTTAYDMALITQRALKHPKFREIVSRLDYLLPKTNKRPESVIHQRNGLLKPGGRFFYSKAIGVKTGFHSNAQNTLVAAASDQGRMLIAILFGCDTRDCRYFDAKKLFETAFAETKMKRIYFDRGAAYQKQIEGAKQPLVAYLASQAAVEFYPAEEPKIKAYIFWEVPAFPIAKEQKVGEMRFLDESGKIVTNVPMLAKEEVKSTVFFALREKWRALFGK